MPIWRKRRLQDAQSFELSVQEGDDGVSRLGVVFEDGDGVPGTAMTLADGADVTQGAKADTAATDDTGSWSLVALIKRLLGKFASLVPLGTDTAALIAGGYTTQAWSTSAVANSPSVDCTYHAWVSVQVTSVGGAGAATYQWSNDGVTWANGYLQRSATAYDAPNVSAWAVGVYHGPRAGRYLRITVSSITSGTFTATITTFTVPSQLPSIGASVNMAQIAGISLTTAGDARTLNTALATTQLRYNGTTLDVLRAVTTFKTAQSTGTASGAELALWTPTTGKRFRVREVSGRVSVAGRYELRDGTATVIRYVYLPANTWVSLFTVEANGYQSTAVNTVLNVYNMSGSAADMDFGASGNEE